MCMDVRVTSWLNSQGHDATHLRDEGLQRLPNGEIFDKAIAESRVIVTFDLDFGEIVALSKGRKTGVILFRLRNTRTSFVVQRLSEIITEYPDALAKGAIVIVEEARQRVREFPWTKIARSSPGVRRHQPGSSDSLGAKFDDSNPCFGYTCSGTATNFYTLPQTSGTLSLASI